MLPNQSNHSSLLIRNEFFVRFLTIFLVLLSLLLLVQALLHTLSTVLSSDSGGEVKIESIQQGLTHPTQAGVGIVSPDSWAKPFPSFNVVGLDDGFTSYRPH
jgi:hypothetical protein